ncbi:MAG: sulfatase-like hydrolase/transferase [Phycisphaeraceae bacterium]|nr:sulfatase-like hydrolase/transferase [Phycisphaeraceae bacterium]
MRYHILTHVALAALFCVSATGAVEQKRPNVLFIAIDDLNDWISVFGGHPKAITPHMDRLAQSGAMVFQNAHCAGPVCCPSRSAMLSGFMPSRSGIYSNSQNMLDAPLVQAHATLPEYFSKHGYVSLSMGKIFHKHAAKNGLDAGQWAYDIYEPARGGGGVNQGRLTSRNKNLINGKPGPPSQHNKGGGTEFAWAPTAKGKEATKDYQTAVWAGAQLQKSYDKPFFMAIGLSKPHLPFFVPQEFFDLYDPKEDYLPPIREDDLEDILTPRGKQKFQASGDYLWLKQNHLLNEAARAYLAATSYADACLGVIFDALKTSPHYNNTIVFVWGDHGWHLGEKLRYRKGTGWSESTRIPFVVRMPGMTQRQDCTGLVNMIDFYPTLIDLCRLPAKSTLDGRSFARLLKTPNLKWDYPTVTINGEGNASVRDERWRFMRYNDGTEELYDLQSDPQEWHNLITNPPVPGRKAMVHLADLLPKTFAKAIPRSKGKYKKVRNLDTTIKATRDLDKLK